MYFFNSFFEKHRSTTIKTNNNTESILAPFRSYKQTLCLIAHMFQNKKHSSKDCCTLTVSNLYTSWSFTFYIYSFIKHFYCLEFVITNTAFLNM